MHFALETDIRGKARPRFTRRGIAYKDARDEAYEEAIVWAYRAAGGRETGWTGEVSVTIRTNRKLPKSTRKSVESEPDTHKPDADNIAKSVLDALNGIAWKDDAQITKLVIWKLPRARREKELLEVEIEYGGIQDGINE